MENGKWKMEKETKSEEKKREKRAENTSINQH
jgi:hypothetical protein